MTLPDGFLFSQSNLQDFVDCQRRFQFRHLYHLAWPAIEAEPMLENERIMDQGALFHKIVRQHLVGVPETQISRTIGEDEIMLTWWENYLHSVKEGILNFIYQDMNQRFAEITLTAPLGKYRLIAKYDLLILRSEDKLTIIDWKTSQNHPKHKWLKERLQTHVYPYLLTQSASSINGGIKVDPDQVEMIYWFTNQPDLPERFPYNNEIYKEDSKYLIDLVNVISKKNDRDFPLTQDTKRCLFCVYRSLCNRGVEPGDIKFLEKLYESDEQVEISLDYDQIAEIEF